MIYADTRLIIVCPFDPGLPKIKLRPRGQYFTSDGEDIMFECKASGYPKPDVKWLLPRTKKELEASISSWPGYGRVQMKATAVVDGKYTCQASNTEGVSQEALFVTGMSLIYP